MLIIKVNCPFLYSSMKKNHKDWADFWHRKMTLKIRILLYLTFNTKYLKPFYGRFHRPSLNSATLSCSSEVTLSHVPQLKRAAAQFDYRLLLDWIGSPTRLGLQAFVAYNSKVKPSDKTFVLTIKIYCSLLLTFRNIAIYHCTQLFLWISDLQQ